LLPRTALTEWVDDVDEDDDVTGPAAPSAGRDAAPSWRLMIGLGSRSL